MKHNLKYRATILSTILATTAILAGCSKEKKETPPPEPETYDNEVVLYVTPQDKVLSTGSSLTYPDHAIWEPEGDPFYLIEVELINKAGIKNDTAWIADGTKYIRKELPDSPITGVEILANADYDDAHPKGSSLVDLMEIDYPKPSGFGYLTMDLAEYFQTMGKVDWREWTFRLSAKTPPSKENETGFYVNMYHPEKFVGVTLMLTLEDGTVIETVPEDWGPMPME